MFENYADPDPDSSGRALPIVAAIFLGLLYLVAIFWIANRITESVRAAFAAFPVAQFLYIGPLAVFAYKSGRKRAMQGWLIGAAVAALLYSPCWGLALFYG